MVLWMDESGENSCISCHFLFLTLYFRSQSYKTLRVVTITKFTRACIFISYEKISALVEWLEYPTPVRVGSGSKPARVEL